MYDSHWKTSNTISLLETISKIALEQEVLDITAIDEEADIIAVSPRVNSGKDTKLNFSI